MRASPPGLGPASPSRCAALRCTVTRLISWVLIGHLCRSGEDVEYGRLFRHSLVLKFFFFFEERAHMIDLFMTWKQESGLIRSRHTYSKDFRPAVCCSSFRIHMPSKALGGLLLLVRSEF